MTCCPFISPDSTPCSAGLSTNATGEDQGTEDQGRIRGHDGVDPKFETLRNRDNCSERRFGWQQPVFSMWSFARDCATDSERGECVCR